MKDSAKRIGLEKLAPHDLRRTCARLCHAARGELEQIQFLLGHVSIQTTQRYLGCKQRIRSAVNDRIDGGVRAWKGQDWDTMERLHSKGYISNPKSKAKSVVLSEEGGKRSKELFVKHFALKR